MGRLFLIRHGESEGNRDRVFTATPEVPLTETGRRQAREAAEFLRRYCAPALLVSSPFRRARETAEIIGEVLDLPLAIEDDLRERNYGEYAGRPYDTARPDFDPAAYWGWRPPGGETLEEVAVRVGRALDRISMRADHRDAVVVSHGAVMMALWRHVMGEWAVPGRVVRNAGILLVEHQGGRYRGATLLERP
ncbi:MAG TPA: histidine phosphatase family protein [Candidatus Limnocylindria bacterium]|nr:histidine phosphatase family protein [Candidatus Limnocylindria bacterium]